MAFIAVPCGTKYFLFSKVPDLIAGALHPDDPFRHGFAKVQLENELTQAVFAGKLELTDPTTLAPLGLPASDALVRVDNLMDYFSGRVLFVRGDSENSDSSEIDNSPAGYFSVREVAELIARAHEWTDAMRETLADRLMAAIESGELILRHPHTLLPDHRMTPRDFYGRVSVEDVNTFLEANKAPYRMPGTRAEAPADAVGVSGAELDFTVLATREQLISAFGAFTGLDRSWFDNLKDSPGLLAARKFTGKGGRGHIAAPLFCPYAVMQWLISPRRRKGRPLSDETAWRMLESHFPKVYARFEIGDPRTD